MGNAAITLTTLKPHRYGRKRVIGEEYEVSKETDAKILVARGFVKLSSATQKPKVQQHSPNPAPAPAVPRETPAKKEQVSQPQTDKPKRTYKRRDKQAE